MARPTDADRAAIYARYGLTCPPRWATLRNFDNPTYGGKVAKIAALLGTPLMPWQRYAADTALEINPATGLLVYRKIGCTVPRQSGKTSLILPVCCHRGMAWQRQRISYAAQSGTAAREKWEDDHVQALEDCKLIPRRAHVRKANGREAIIWRATRSIHGLHANTEKSGHGKTLHLGMLDEYFAQVDHRIAAAWSPAMITVAMAQSWWFSTAGTSKSVPMNEDRQAGRELIESGQPTNTAYFDWSSLPGADRTDPATWLNCMPALCPTEGPCRCSPDWRHTVTLDAMRAELDSANTPKKIAEFDRAYLNITREDDEVDADPNMPTPEEWELLADANVTGGDVLALAIDVTPLGDRAAITAVGEGPDGPDGPVRSALIEHHPGMAWVVQRAAELKDELRPVAWVIDERSRARELLEPLERAGIKRPQSMKDFKRGDLWIPTTQDVGAACGAWCGGVKNARMVHRGQPAMQLAVAGARTRSLGDGLFAFGRRVSSADISPLVTSALAKAGYEKFKHLAVEKPYDPLANIW